MKYLNKKTLRLKKKMINSNEGDELKDPMDRYEQWMKRKETKLSRGGKYERSHNKKVGNIVNKNIDKRYNVAQKTIERISRNLKEEWVDSIKTSKGKLFDIFVNPTPKELSELEDFVRFIVDWKNKKIYVFDHFLLHKIAADKLKIPYNPNKYFPYYFGISKIKNGKLIKLSELLKILKSKPEEKEWLNKYFINLITVKEEWVDTITSRYGRESKGKTFDIFVNPTPKELNELGQLRIIIDRNNKKLYVFDYKLLHADAARRLKFPYSEEHDDKNYIFSYGKSYRGKIVLGEWIKTQLTDKEDWLKKYLTDYETEV